MLEKKTIEKKKQALAEEKNIISERLNFRKKMMDQEAKDEELAELKRQYNLISSDSTRTKEANELRRKIAEMEKDQAYQDAQDLANAEMQELDEKSKAWDTYISNNEEDLNELLSNANNFRETLDNLLSGSFEDFVAWNAKYNTSYKKSTDEQREQMVQGWDDTWYNMLGLLRTYWDEVDETMRSKDAWMSLALSTDDYLKLSDTGKESYEWNMSELYDAYTNSLIDNAEFSDNHEILDKVDELKDWTFTVKVSDLEDYVINPLYSDYIYKRSTAGADAGAFTYNDYAGWGIDKPVYSEPAASSGSGEGDGSGSGSGSGSNFVSTWYEPIDASKHRYCGKSSDGTTHVIRTEAHSFSNDVCTKCGYRLVKDYLIPNNIGGAFDAKGNVGFAKAKGTLMGELGPELYVQDGKYAVAGQNGPEFVDLDNDAIVFNHLQTKSLFENGMSAGRGKAVTNEYIAAAYSAGNLDILRNKLNDFDYVNIKSFLPSLEGLSMAGSNVSIGDINVNLYEAKLENDADYNEVARKVGNAFSKQLQKNGLNLAGYAW